LSDLAIRPTGAVLALRYAGFAGVATLVNLAVQAASLQLYEGPFHLAAAMALGTLAGLLPKYLLDKRWIFADRSGGHARKFTLYTAMAVATTLVFWVTEWGFDRIGHGDGLHYLGAVLGLAIGYWIKYRLDRRFVFRAAG
jgi:putative flippase GtrA